ncbi:hypothetical protein NDU88_004682 [Pleurodeles waltl]|uniref:Uncharacterized protein n=1 Tax=Pleurodeles waltl TaxID=8319 RepID=A0AAV7WSL2_PLEWA|nr:hypothetical protein NDU88_004682 [Pleurodeles waltl]
MKRSLRPHSPYHAAGHVECFSINGRNRFRVGTRPRPQKESLGEEHKGPLNWRKGGENGVKQRDTGTDPRFVKQEDTGPN